MSGFCPRFFIAQEGTAAPGEGLPAVGDQLTLSSDDSYHALRVLRLKAGDHCEVVVGAAVYAASVRGTKAPLGVTLTARLQGEAAGAVYRSQVGLVQALTRPALMDEVFEKGTEVGASFFVVVAAAGSVRLPEASWANRLERWRRIVLEAAKQSKQSLVPTVEIADSPYAALGRLQADGVVSLLLEPSAPVPLRHLVQSRASTEAQPASVALWVGPESGWSADELERFAAAGMESAKLGQSVLRAETAGPVAVAVTRLVLGDW